MSEKNMNENKPDFEELFDTYYDKLYRYAYSILLNRENAEDVVSETFCSAMMSYASYDSSIASPATWLVRIAHNKAVDLVRSAAYRKTDGLPEYYDVPASGNFAEETEDRQMQLYLYSKLSLPEREFLDMRYVMGLKDAEVAGIYGLPVKTVNKRYQRLLEKCRKILGE